MHEIATELRVTVPTVIRYLGVRVAERRRHDVLALHKRGLVPTAIADRLEPSDRTVARYLVGVPRSRYGRGYIGARAA